MLSKLPRAPLNTVKSLHWDRQWQKSVCNNAASVSKSLNVRRDRPWLFYKQKVGTTDAPLRVGMNTSWSTSLYGIILACLETWRAFSTKNIYIWRIHYFSSEHCGWLDVHQSASTTEQNGKPGQIQKPVIVLYNINPAENLLQIFDLKRSWVNEYDSKCSPAQLLSWIWR